MRFIPLAQILLANLIWGFGFVATAWALQSFNFVQIFFLRFFLAGVLGLTVYALFSRKEFSHYLKSSFLPALFLSLEVIFQIYSLQSTKAMEGGFLFVTYIFMIPALEYLFYKKTISKGHFFWILLGFFGSYLMLQQEGFSVSFGELSMLGSAFFASCHVIVIDRTDRNRLNAFFLNSFQLIWGLILFLPFLMFFSGGPAKSISQIGLFGLIWISFGSTLIAYYLQIKAQEKISPAVIGILFLSESIFAAGFSHLCLGEALNQRQWLGAIAIAISALFVSLEFLRLEKYKKSTERLV